MPQLSEEAFDKIIPLLEAELAYNSVWLAILERLPEDLSVQQFSLMAAELGVAVAPTDPSFQAIMADLSKEKQFFKTYLERFVTEEDQQKVLDDLFEELRFGLHTLTSSYEQIKNDPAGIVTRNYTRNNIESLNNIKEIVEPYLSDFGKIFAKYNKLAYNPRSYRTGYLLDGYKKYLEEIQNEIEKLETSYRAHDDEIGLNDIRNRKSILTDPTKLILVEALKSPGTPRKEEDPTTLHRQLFYYVYRSLEEAKKLHQQRMRLSCISSSKKAGVISEADAKVRKDLVSSDQREEALVADLAPSSEVVAVSDLSAAKPAAASPSLDPAESKRLQEKAKRVMGALSKKPTPKPKDVAPKPVEGKPLIDPKNQRASVLPFQQPKAKASRDVKERADIQEIAKKLSKNRYKDILVDLFYGDIRKIKIEESSLRSILERVGGKFDGSREAVRRQLSFRGKLGFVPNNSEPDIVIKAHYHTKNQRYASPAMLAHYRDFFGRIGLAPHELWEGYEKPAHLPTKTTRIYAQNGK